MAPNRYQWEDLDDESLLQVRLCDLRLRIEKSSVQAFIERLYAELAEKNIRFKPSVWISTAWFSPYGIPGFAIPFYLLHPRLAKLEKKLVGEVEGGTAKWCMQLLRHETGHAIDNAFLLRKSKKRQELFGLSGTRYPKFYRPNPTSKCFVRHLNDHYAQAHPDEDWAETFAVWLDPRSEWRRDYPGSGARRKLEFLDQMLGGIAGLRPLVTTRENVEDIRFNKQTLGSYFSQKLASTIKARNYIIKNDLSEIAM